MLDQVVELRAVAEDAEDDFGGEAGVAGVEAGGLFEQEVGRIAAGVDLAQDVEGDAAGGRHYTYAGTSQWLKLLRIRAILKRDAFRDRSGRRGGGGRTDGCSRTDRNSLLAHEQLLEKKKAGRIDIYFEGDSIVRRWGATDYPALLENWRQNFFGWNAADFGWGADKVENILWRLENGELDGIAPKVIVLLAGTNNVGAGGTAAEVQSWDSEDCRRNAG